MMPTTSHHNVFLLDLGANVNCTPEILFQYGVMGSVLAQEVAGIPSPRVALLNVGEEDIKGNAQVGFFVGSFAYNLPTYISIWDALRHPNHSIRVFFERSNTVRFCDSGDTRIPLNIQFLVLIKIDSDAVFWYQIVCCEKQILVVIGGTKCIPM